MYQHPKNEIIYQLAMRTFTPEGTIKAAEARLAYVASLGVDIVYLCPVFMAENDQSLDTWSPRQKASQTGNPKNPYKMYDYFHVDEEYGTDEDLKHFVKTAHRLGLKVLFDLVYLHCGRGAVFLAEHPDFIERNEDGTDVVGELWPFARLNYQNPALREYLLSNMQWFLREFSVDGFRCDVGDRIPLDFWEWAFERLRAEKPDLLTFNEGKNPAYLEKAFDICYSFHWRAALAGLFRGEHGANEFRALCLAEREEFGDRVKRRARYIDNHDTASDVGLLRNEIVMTERGVEAALVVTNTYDGVPFLWNGVEFCDAAENNMFSNRDHGRRSAMDWSTAFTARGKRRMRLLKKLHALHHSTPAITEGFVEWVENDRPDDVLSYRKRYGGQEVLVVVNAKNRALDVRVDAAHDEADVCLRRGAKCGQNALRLQPYGYLLFKKG